jgi:PilZ domain-containing protein
VDQLTFLDHFFYTLVMELEPAISKRDRKYPRVNVKLRADSRIRLPDMNPEWFSPNITNLGGGGLTFDFPTIFPLGTLLQMHLFCNTDEIDLVGKVIWTNKIGDFRNITFNCGIMYTNISQDNQAKINRIVSVHVGGTGNLSHR